MKKFLTDNFGYTLKNIRENLKLTQTAVFQGILTRSTWSSYESGNMIPDMITFITLLERMGYLQIDLSSLFRKRYIDFSSGTMSAYFI